MGKNVDRLLYDAVKAGDQKKVEEFLAKGANPDAPVGKKGMTCMERAAKLKTRDLERLLTMKGGTLHASSSLAPDPSEASSEATSAPSNTGTMVVRRETFSPTTESPNAAPVPLRMSRLAMGIRESFRKPSQASVVVEGTPVATVPDETVEPSEWQLPEDNLDEYGHREWEFDRKRLQQVRKLGEGTFGIVFEGVAAGIMPGQDKTSVAVKMLSSKVEQAADDFFKEAKIMKAIGSKPTNIVRLMGLCTKEEPYLMIMELMRRGDLKTVLRENRPKSKKPSIVSYRRMALMGADIAKGMEYLAHMRIVHRDLAARNCLVDEDWTVKIGDFGLTRDVYSQEYYKMTGAAPLPIRWMAPESIQDGVYSTQTDLWSYGIVLWELATFSKMPYAGLSNMEVCEKVSEDGYRLPKPKNCPNELYKVMLTLWDEEPGDRGSFSEHYATFLACSEGLSDAPIAKDGFVSQAQLPSLEAEEEEPEPAEGTPSADRKDEYYTQQEKEDPDNQKLYVDQSGAGLDSMSLAIQRARQAQEVQEIEKVGAAKAVTMRETKGKEMYASSEGLADGNDGPYYDNVQNGKPAFDPAKFQYGFHEDAMNAYQLPQDTLTKASAATMQLQPAAVPAQTPAAPAPTRAKTPEPAPAPAPAPAREPEPEPEPERSQSTGLRSPAAAAAAEERRLLKTMKHEQKSVKKQAKQEAKQEKKLEKKAKSVKKKYGGASSWVTGGASPPVALDLLHARGATEPAPEPVNKAESPLKASQTANKEQPAAAAAAAADAPKQEALPRAGRPSFGAERAPLAADATFVPWRRTESGLVDISAAEAAKEAFSLTNDFSSTANKARDAQAAILIQAEKETAKWLEAVIGDYLSEDTLQKSLRSGEVLCQAMNKIKSGAIPNYHKNKSMAFKQMENIGRFLEACQTYGVMDKDLFVTVDLFENRNFKQVLNCIGALRKIAEARGFHTG